MCKQLLDNEMDRSAYSKHEHPVAKNSSNKKTQNRCFRCFESEFGQCVVI